MRNLMRFEVPTQRLRNGLILLFLILSFAGCAMTPETVVHKTERESPPPSLLLAVKVPEWPGRMTNWELLELARTFRKQVLECNADKDALTKWAEQGGEKPVK